MVQISRKQLFLFFGAVLLFAALAGGVFFWLQWRQQQLEQTTAIKQGQEIIEQEADANQFPSKKENGSYHFLCVSGDVITQQPPIRLPTGQEVSHTLPCYYHDASSQEQTIHLPLYTYHLEEKTSKHLGYKIKTDVSEHLILNSKKGWTEHWPGAIGRLERAGWTGPGHIFYVALALPTTDNDLNNLSSGGYFNQALKKLVSPQAVEQFVQAGDPSLFPQTTNGELLILPVGVSFNSRFAAMQQEQNESE